MPTQPATPIGWGDGEPKEKGQSISATQAPYAQNGNIKRVERPPTGRSTESDVSSTCSRSFRDSDSSRP